MKKLLVGLLVALVCFSTTACGSSGSLKCTKVETDEDGNKTTDTIEVTYKNDKVTKVEDTSIMEMDSEYIDLTYSILSAMEEEFNKIDGFEAKYTKEDNSIKSVVSVDYSKIDLDKLKEAFGDSFEDDSFYASKDVSIDDFKKENLEGYTCE